MHRILLTGLVAVVGCGDDGRATEDDLAEQPEELILAVRADSAATGAALTELLSGTVLSVDPPEQYSIARVTPDPAIDYKIRIIRPDPSVSYKVLQVDPGAGPGPFEFSVVDPENGQVLPRETEAVRALVDRMARLRLLERFYQHTRADTQVPPPAPATVR